MRGDAYSSALRDVVTRFLGTRDGATLYAKRISGLDQHYDLGDSHPIVGSVAPRLDGTLLAAHEGRALLVDLAGDEEVAVLAKPYASRLELVRSRAEDAGLSGLLVRPDGFVAWASAGGTDGLEAALTRWLGHE
ncbi:aromatic-ring hydroxylase C-terminal domain-containing protein [Amycolatopsis heterodermiae]|uniref:aromatic-ring hydroxylase C-terminal domain-containing protein n=1 Tax=Amycolatopsis heterodermiae TaxID=3110235 RepID=UPI00396A71D2